MKTSRIFAALAACCIAIVSCTKTDPDANTVTINGATYENVKASCMEGHGLYFKFDFGGGITGTGLVDNRIGIETLTFGKDGGYGDWLAIDVSYPGDKYYSAVPETGTQTIKKKGNAYSVVIDGKDENGKDYKVNILANIVKEL